MTIVKQNFEFKLNAGGVFRFLSKGALSNVESVLDIQASAASGTSFMEKSRHWQNDRRHYTYSESVNGFLFWC